MHLFLKSLFIYFFLSNTLLQAFSLAEMTLEEKVGQTLMVHFHGREANDDASALIQSCFVGGIIYYNWSNGLNSPEQIRFLSESLQKLTKSNPTPIPLLIAVDQEGGLVSRLTKGFTIFPGNRALGMTHDPRLAYFSALAMGQELMEVGVNMNLSPVVDVDNPDEPIIGIRSFSENPEDVVNFSEMALKGYHQVGVMTTLKHFPGHGDARVDSHEGLPVVNKSLSDLKKRELLPYFQLAGQADVVMTAHMLMRALDPYFCTTLSKPSLDFLRNEIGFTGVIISDSLVMEGLLKNCDSIEKAALQAFIAGCDVLLLGGKQLIGSNIALELKVKDIQRIQNTLVQGVKSGLISEERLNQSVTRILSLKEHYGLGKVTDFSKDLNPTLNIKDHQLIAEEIAAKSLRMIRTDNFDLTSLGNKKLLISAPSILEESLVVNPIFQENPKALYTSLNPTDQEIQEALESTKSTDAVLFFSCNAWKNKAQVKLFKELVILQKPIIVICVRDSIDANLFPEASVIITTSSPTTPSIQAVSKLLTQNET